MRLLTESRAGVSTGVTFAGTLVNAGLAFVTTGIVSNGVGATGTAAFFQAIALYAIFASALSLGADTALVRGVSRALARDEHDRIWPMVCIALGPVLIVSLAGAIVVWLFAPEIGMRISPGSPDETADYLRLLAPILPMTPLLAVSLGATRGMGAIYPYTLVQNLLIPITRTGLVACVVFAGAQIKLILLAWAAPLVLGVLVAMPIMVRACRIPMVTRKKGRTASARGEFGPLWRFAIPRGLAALVERGLEWADVLLVIYFVGPAPGGIYAVVRRVIGVGGLFEGSLRIVIGPRVSRALTTQDKGEFRAVFKEATAVLVLMSWPLYLSLIVYAKDILALFGSEFELGATALRVACVAMLLEVSAGMLQSSLLMGGRSHWQLMNKTCQLLVLMSGCILLVPLYGINGAAISWLLGCLVNITMAGTQVWRKMGARTSLRALLIPSTSAFAIFGFGGFVFSNSAGRGVFPMLVGLSVSCVAYVLVCYKWRREIGIQNYWERA